MRVVSLLPSATELLAALGASDMLVGRSHECDHPPGVGTLPALTSADDRFVSSAATDERVRAALAAGDSLYRLDERRLRELEPDLIVTQDLCAVCSIDPDTVRETARRLDPPPPVVALNPTTFEDVLEDALTLGTAIGREAGAQQLVLDLRTRLFRAMDLIPPFAARPSVLFLEWTDPMFVAGHWTVQLIERAGADHPLNPTTPMDAAGAGAGAGQSHRAAGHSFTVTPEQVTESAPDAVIICPCGLTLDQAVAEANHLLEVDWFRDLPAVRGGRVVAVDGNQHFNRPGPRLVEAFEWLVGWLNGIDAVLPRAFPARALAPRPGSQA
ncbi:MAG: ABC transporter substrate-binding protein [Planctomycetota bacterium]